jgi:acetolactate synthase I/II/III large subunit
MGCTARYECTRSAASRAELRNPDLLALAQAYGAFGASVSRTEEFASVFDEASSRKGAAIIELKIDPEMITTRTTLSEIRRQAEARRGEP